MKKLIKIITFIFIGIIILFSLFCIVINKYENNRESFANTYYFEYTDDDTKGGEYLVLWKDGNGIVYSDYIINNDTVKGLSRTLNWECDNDTTLSIKFQGDKNFTTFRVNNNNLKYSIWNYIKVDTIVYTQENYNDYGK